MGKNPINTAMNRNLLYLDDYLDLVRPRQRV